MQSWLKKYLSEEDKKKISGAIHQAELHTSGEIVTMIVRRSSAIGHLPLLLTFAFTVLFLLCEMPELMLDWLHIPYWSWPIVVAIFYFISLLLARCSLLQRWLTPALDQAEQVMRRAELEFYTAGVHKTKRSTSILIFLSMMERRAVVLADKSIAEKLPASTWADEIDIIIRAIKDGCLAEGLIQAIGQAGEHLHEHFPAEKADENELTNELLIK